MSSVHKDWVLPGQVISQYMVSSYDSKPVLKDVAKVHAEYRGFVGELPVLVHQNPDPQVLIGNDLAFLSFKHSLVNRPSFRLKFSENVGCQTDGNYQNESANGSLTPECQESKCFPVMTRNRAKSSNVLPAELPVVSDSNVAEEQETMSIDFTGCIEFKQAVQMDPSLQDCRNAVLCDVRARPDKRVRFYFENDLLYREYQPKNSHEYGEPVKQLVVPQPYRLTVLEMAHDCLFAAHLGVKRTLEKVTRQFFWPKVHEAVQLYVQTCLICQKAGFPKDNPVYPLKCSDIEDEPFSKVAVDILGPLPKVTPRGKKFIITIVDFATRHLEAIPVSNISAATVARSIMAYACRYGLPKTLFTDLGTNFVSQLMKKMCELAKINHQTSPAYSHWCTGLVERYNQLIASLIRKYCLEHGNDWDQSLMFLVSAFNDSPQGSLGVSPNFLIFGRSLNTPLVLLKQQWEGVKASRPQSVADYFRKLHATLADAWKNAQEHLKAAQQTQKRNYDRSAVPREFALGDKVLMLVPERPNKLTVKWMGPGEVVEKLSEHRYVIKCPEVHSKPKIYHVNSLKKFYDRSVCQFALKSESDPPDVPVDFLAECEAEVQIEDVMLNSALSEVQVSQLLDVLKQYDTVFTNKPGRTTRIKHSIDTGSAKPIVCHSYRVSGQHAKDVVNEIQSMPDLKTLKSSHGLKTTLVHLDEDLLLKSGLNKIQVEDLIDVVPVLSNSRNNILSNQPEKDASIKSNLFDSRPVCESAQMFADTTSTPSTAHFVNNNVKTIITSTPFCAIAAG